MQIQSLTLHTASLPRTRLFYHKTLELPIVSETEDAITFRAGRSRLTFRAAAEGKPFYHIAFNVTNNRFSDLYEWMSRKLDLLPVTADDMYIAAYPNWNAQSFYFLDNNGSILEFIVRFDLPYFSDQVVSSADIREISEVGIPVASVQEAAERLQAQVPYFSRGPRLPEFSPMGDDEGLLLLVQQGRPWVPTHKGAKAFPLRIEGAGNFTFEIP